VNEDYILDGYKLAHTIIMQRSVQVFSSGLVQDQA
jgi:hypothetical protein